MEDHQVEAVRGAASLGPRARGDVARVVVQRRVDREGSAIVRGRSAGPLRLLFPRAAGRAAWIVQSSLGGGLVDGDDVRLTLEVGEGAVALLTSQASQKVYRGTSRFALAARVESGAVLLAVPDPTVPYAGATFTQQTAIDLAPGASLAFMDVLTAGRVAHGERWASDRIDASLELSRASTVVLRDRVLLDPAASPIASKMRRFDALGTVVLLGPAFGTLAARVLADGGLAPGVAPGDVTRGDIAIGVGAIDDGVFVRLAAPTVGGAITATRALVREACGLLGEDPFGRKW